LNLFYTPLEKYSFENIRKMVDVKGGISTRLKNFR
jgi:hypothetical protein